MLHPDVMLIDSFLVRDGCTTRLNAHVARFVCSVRECFGSEVADRIPAVYEDLDRHVAAGRRFPRIEATHDSVTWRDRPAPPQREVLTMAAHPVEDRRQFPQHKGADLTWLQTVGGDVDALLERDGYVTETTTAAIVLRAAGKWVAPLAKVMPSTTLAWFSDRIVAIESRPVVWQEVVDAAAAGQAFALNALHGPRALVIGEGAASAESLELARQWRDQWFADAEPLR